MRNLLLFAFLTITLYSCKDLPHIDGFDQEVWKSDLDGCQNKRLTLIDTLMAQQDKLKGLGQNELTKILGKADQHELYERSQKFFIYHLQPGSNCENYSGNYFQAFYIRFNSLDQAVAFTVQEIN